MKALTDGDRRHIGDPDMTTREVAGSSSNATSAGCLFLMKAAGWSGW